MSSRMDTVIETRRLVLKVPSLKEFGDEPAHTFYQGTLNGDTVRREMTVVIV